MTMMSRAIKKSFYMEGETMITHYNKLIEEIMKTEREAELTIALHQFVGSLARAIEEERYEA